MTGTKSFLGTISNRNRQAVIVAGCFLLTGTSTLAQASASVSGGSDASMDSVWSDQNKTGKTAGNAPAKPASSSDEASTTWSSNSASKSDSADDERSAKGKAKNAKKISTVAPLCTIDSFARSALVQTGAWANVGPFKMSEGGASQLVDDAKNSIKLKANRQQKITGVEMVMKGRPAHDFMSVEMATDFLLEALGSKPGRISELNTQLETMKSKLLKQGTGEQNFNAGRYLIAIKPLTPASLGISVSSADASAEAIKDHSQNTTDLATVDNTDEDSAAEIRRRVNAMIHRGPEATRRDDAQSTTKKPKSPQPTEAPAAEDTPEASSNDSVKDALTKVLQNWQQIKKVAVKTRDTKALSKVLAGNALSKQTKGVKWLAEHHKYYDTTPLSVDILKYAEVTKGTKYIVTARVKEASKFYEDGQSTPLRMSEDSYNVNYTVDKVGDHFVISDSAMVDLSAPLSPKLSK
ncbi:MAG: ARC6/PARC6 family protein [Candidatus Obscuribacterales bacterium]|nr:ARC6/PARC6 family protein [Candidatus Obscuribacterales bacterium]